MGGNGRASPALRRRNWSQEQETLADGSAEVAAITHEEKSGDGFEGVEKAEHAALALAHAEGK